MRPLNVLIGPNGAGKSNMIEALEMLAAAPEDNARPLKRDERLREWLWKGEAESREAEIEVVMGPTSGAVGQRLMYRLTANSLRGPLETLVGTMFRATRRAPPRNPQPADLPDDRLIPDGGNLALVLNRIEQAGESMIPYSGDPQCELYMTLCQLCFTSCSRGRDR
jgi:predicted ATPase